jgi:AraC-like DNA-binding protein
MLLDQLEKSLDFTQALIVTTFPRGALQLAQPSKLPELLLKGYTREFHTEDRLTWRAIMEGVPVTARDAFGPTGFEESRYLNGFLLPSGLRFGAAAPLRSPVIEGYAGAVHLYRSADSEAFSQTDLKRLDAFARQIDTLTTRQRSTRRGGCERAPRLSPRPSSRQFIYDSRLREVGKDDGRSIALDGRLREQVVEAARSSLRRVDGGSIEPERLLLPDVHGELWTLRLVTYRSYPALGHGPRAIICIQPDSCDWAALRQTDLQADPEVARLVPAMKFMQQEFRRSPTLGEISRTVHLSPFHFHRRFAELFGLTPKHFMLECQINQAKLELLSREKDLARIAVDCGFAHQSHFTSRFKQATGLTPTRWRRLALEARSQSN